MTMWKEDFVLHLKWAAAPCPTLAVMGMFADVIYGDKTVGKQKHFLFFFGTVQVFKEGHKNFQPN